MQQCIDATGWEEMLIPRPSFMRSKSLRTESKLIKRAPFNAPFSSWPHAGDLGARRVSSSKGKFGRLMKSRVDRQVRIVYELASYSLNRALMLRVLYYILKVLYSYNRKILLRILIIIRSNDKWTELFFKKTILLLITSYYLIENVFT